MAFDGNSFFNAIADQLDGEPTNGDKYRRDTLNHIQKNEDFFRPLVPKDETWEGYISRMTSDRQMAGPIEIRAVSELFEVNLIVFQRNDRKPIVRLGIHEWGSVRTLTLSYHL